MIPSGGKTVVSTNNERSAATFLMKFGSGRKILRFKKEANEDTMKETSNELYILKVCILYFACSVLIYGTTSLSYAYTPSTHSASSTPSAASTSSNYSTSCASCVSCASCASPTPLSLSYRASV